MLPGQTRSGGSPIVWTMHTIDNAFLGVWPAYAADIDHDAYLDVVAGGFDADEIRWWRNELARAGDVRLVIYDISGRLVRTLADGAAEAGSHGVTWNGLDDPGREMPSGLYFYRLVAGAAAETGPMTLLR